jgi:hypothetical protein
MRIVDQLVDIALSAETRAGVSTMASSIEAARVAAELVRASVEGRLKRKRTLDFEKDKLVKDLDKLWTDAKKKFAKDGSMYGMSTHDFEYAPNFHELEPTKQDVENGLPEELKEVAKLDGFNLLVKDADTGAYSVVLEYIHPVERVVQARISNGEWE